MASVTLTNRELKNKATGLDIRVPQYEHISGTFGGAVVYHVIVVTQLFYFKTPNKHKESDVVQFMIPQKYEAFEELCSKLSQKFPSVVFDPPPKKAFLVNESVISERRQYMEDVLQKIAKTPKLACSSLVLEFLGAKRGHKEINRLEETQSNIKEEDSTGKTSAQQEIVEDVDLFASSDDKDGQHEDNEEEEELLSSTAPVPRSNIKGFSIFRTDDDKEDDDGDMNNLFVPAGADERKEIIDIDVEDNSKLLEIEDDLDKLLTVKSKSQKPPKPTAKPTAKPRLKPKPNLKPKPTPKPRFVEAGAGEDELFGAAGDAKDKNINSVKERVHASGDQDLFDQARKSSFRTSSHEEETLDDIFNTPSQRAFTTTEDDDDLFKKSSAVEESSVQDMSVDDIASYIQQNTPDSNVKLDLF